MKKIMSPKIKEIAFLLCVVFICSSSICCKASINRVITYRNAREDIEEEAKVKYPEKKQIIAEMKNRWRETADYPVKFLEDEWQETQCGYLEPVISKEWKDLEKKVGPIGMIDVIDPPEDVINNLSTEELAALMQRWPRLIQVTAYNDDGEKYYIFWGYAETNSGIFRELLSREDGYLCILKEYRRNPFDVEKNNENPYFIGTFDLTNKAEIFGCQFIRYFNQFFTQEEYELATEIIEEKLALYEGLSEESEARFWLNLTYIDPPKEEGVPGKRSYTDLVATWNLQSDPQNQMHEVLERENEPKEDENINEQLTDKKAETDQTDGSSEKVTAEESIGNTIEEPIDLSAAEPVETTVSENDAKTVQDAQADNSMTEPSHIWLMVILLSAAGAGIGVGIIIHQKRNGKR